VRSRLSIAVSATVAACALVGVSQASASTLAVDAGGTLRFHASWGEVNHVNATDVNAPNTMVVTDSGSTIHAGNGCLQVSAHEAKCAEAGFQDFAIGLADGDDFAHAFALAFPLSGITITGGYGDDTIEDLPQSGAYVSGGPGADTITVHPNFGGKVGVHGDGGDDSITAISATGVVDGDAGEDQITLRTFVEPPSGTPSAAYGGTGDDTISAEGGTDISLIDAEGGDDTITTTDFAMVAVVNGSGGADTISAETGFPEQINGGFGRDVINGGGGGDTIDCGPAIDRYAVFGGDAVTNCEIPFTP
jgi:hypothetical protein